MKLKTKIAIDYNLGIVLTALLKPWVRLLGWLLGRSHDPTPKGSVAIMKLLGGGSLLIAFPALLGLRQRYPDATISLVTTTAIAPFARTLGVFDRIEVIDDRSLLSLALTGLRALARTVGVDTIVDLEVYSRLSTVFTLLTLARNRIGFYVDSVFWRRPLQTHLIFFNRNAGVYLWYDAIVRLLGAEPGSMAACRELLRRETRIQASDAVPDRRRIAVGHGCSDLAKERELTPAQWVEAFRAVLGGGGPAEVHFLGGREDRASAEAARGALAAAYPAASFLDHAGELSLEESVRLLASCSVFHGIDSSLLHYARLLGLTCTSYWGPTDPTTRLRPVPGLDETVRYERIPCSPCVHLTEDPPCRGKNVCIRNLFDPQRDLETLYWLA